jgi:hypothetical protein
MENLHLKNLNNTDPIENYLNQLEKYEKEIEDLSTEKLTLFSEITDNENEQKHINLLNNIDNKKKQIKQTKEKHKILTITLLNYFLKELEQLKAPEQKHYNNIEIIRSWIIDLKRDRKRYIHIRELRYLNNNIKNMKD